MTTAWASSTICVTDGVSAGRSGATKVQLAERRDGRNHILEHVGTARSEAELAVLMAKARERLRPGQDALDLVVAGEPATGRPGVITGKRSAVLWQALSGVYDRLGFDVLGDDAFRRLVSARIIEPTSEADSLRVLDEIGVGHASLRTIFRSLQRAGSGDCRGQIATACFSHASTNGDVSLCLSALRPDAPCDEPRATNLPRRRRGVSRWRWAA